MYFTRSAINDKIIYYSFTRSRILASFILLAIGWGQQSLAADFLSSSKRGLASPDLTTDDLAQTSDRISWWYNWGALPNQGLESHAEQHGVPFVPMIWNSDINQESLRSYLREHPEINYILGFNEPNFASQANLTPQQAADSWGQIEAIADEFSLKIIGPSVNYSPGDVDIPGSDDNGSPFVYLDAFFQACQGCRVDAIGVHGYMSAPEYFTDYIQQFHDRYQKPIWVTEWNLDKGADVETVEESMNFLATTVRWMEAQDYVTHYAWFLGRGAQANDLLTDDHQWTALGRLYQGIPAIDHTYTLPEKIEAESANSIRGVNHRTTFADGKPIIQLFSDGDDALLQFNIYSPTQRIYNWTLKYAAEGGATIAVRVDDNDEQVVTLENTGSPYYWQQHTQLLSLPAGRHQLTLRSISGRPNFDWLRFE